MARRKPKYPNTPYVVGDDARRRFQALMKPEEKESQVPQPKWELWRWDDLTDVPQDLTVK